MRLQYILTYLAPILFVLIMIPGINTRLQYAASIKHIGKDLETHLEAIGDFLSGVNPYLRTVESYKELESDPGDKGYAYFPIILYINTVMLLLFQWLNPWINGSADTLQYPFTFFSALPSIIATVCVAVVFYKELKTKSVLAMLFCTAYWIYNPFFIARTDSEGYDAIAVAFMIWSLYLLGKNSSKSFVLYFLSFMTKTFSIILWPIFLLENIKKETWKKDVLKLGLIGTAVFLLLSIPFILSWEDLRAYITGALLVHGDRFVQGRPYLYYISYFYRVELFRIIPFKLYSIGAIILGPILILLVYTLREYVKSIRIKQVMQRLSDKYVLASISFLAFYLLTPVLNRTYTIWAIPVFLLGTFELAKKRLWLFYTINISYWVFIHWYLSQWEDGFHIWTPIY